MATRAMDVVTILHALKVLSEKIKTTEWNAYNPEQEQIFALLKKLGPQLDQIKGLEALASRYYEELNKFLTDHRFNPMVDPFDPAKGIGVVAILDKLVKWRNGPGEKVQIRTSMGEKPGFELPVKGVNIYEVDGYPGSHLLELLTKSEDTLWLFVHKDEAIEGLGLANLAFDVMSKSRKIPMSQARFSGRGQYQTFAGAQVPMIDFDIMPDLSWLLGADTTGDDGYFYVAQAKQQFKMRIDETGAHVKVATVVVTMRGITEGPRIFVVDRPFYGWWTQQGLETFPMAAFFADYESWVKPAGSLEDM